MNESKHTPGPWTVGELLPDWDRPKRQRRRSIRAGTQGPLLATAIARPTTVLNFDLKAVLVSAGIPKI